ncbi:MAG: mercury resistance system transport protein MerF [Pseudomonadota bacterium]
MNWDALFKTGVVGGVLAGVCCFTPILVLLLGAVGLTAWVGWVDWVLLPSLGFFVGLTGYAFYRKRLE